MRYSLKKNKTLSDSQSSYRRILENEVVTLKIDLASWQERADILQNNLNQIREQFLASQENMSDILTDLIESKQIAEGLAIVVTHLQLNAERSAVERSVLFEKIKQYESDIERPRNTTCDDSGNDVMNDDGVVGVVGGCSGDGDRDDQIIVGNLFVNTITDDEDNYNINIAGVSNSNNDRNQGDEISQNYKDHSIITEVCHGLTASNSNISENIEPVAHRNHNILSTIKSSIGSFRKEKNNIYQNNSTSSIKNGDGDGDVNGGRSNQISKGDLPIIANADYDEIAQRMNTKYNSDSGGGINANGDKGDSNETGVEINECLTLSSSSRSSKNTEYVENRNQNMASTVKPQIGSMKKERGGNNSWKNRRGDIRRSDGDNCHVCNEYSGAEADEIIEDLPVAANTDNNCNTQPTNEIWNNNSGDHIVDDNYDEDCIGEIIEDFPTSTKFCEKVILTPLSRSNTFKNNECIASTNQNETSTLNFLRASGNWWFKKERIPNGMNDGDDGNGSGWDTIKTDHDDCTQETKESWHSNPTRNDDDNDNITGVRAFLSKNNMAKSQNRIYIWSSWNSNCKNVKNDLDKDDNDDNDDDDDDTRGSRISFGEANPVIEDSSIPSNTTKSTWNRWW